MEGGVQEASCLVVVQTFTSSTQVQTGFVTRFFFHMCVFLEALWSAVPFHGRQCTCHRPVAAEQLFEDIERWIVFSIPSSMYGIFLGGRLAARTLPPVTIRELRLALQDEWQQCLNNSLTPSLSAWADAVKPA
ncbi:hypothetical protein TNCV_2408821 [Trichonephila clavipes]|nr:hypothetical protein TNCV_2408821 [Trichonephila clavipes]